MCQENFNGECSSGKGRKALVAFVETLVSVDAPFDSGTLSAAAKNGQALFEGKAGCINCHNGAYFSDGQPHNTGMPENMDVFKDPLRHIAYRAVMTNHGVPKRRELAARRGILLCQQTLRGCRQIRDPDPA